MKIMRGRRLDAAIIVLAAVVLVSSLTESVQNARFGSAIAAASLLVLLARDRHPPAASVVGFALVVAGAHLEPQAPPPVFVAILAAFGIAGTLRDRRSAVAAWVVGCGALVAAMAGNPYVEGASDIALTSTFCTIIWASGLLATERGRSAGAAAARADLVEQQRDLDVADATAHERGRIAGELHDIVSHGLSIVIVQTVAARMSLQDHPASPEVDRRLEAVETTAREALDDMRRMLDLLRPDGSAATQIRPAAGLAEVEALVEHARTAGLPVELELDVAEADLPAGLDAAAYRIVQEALTNVLKHAPGSRTEVRIGCRDSWLDLAVVNGLRPAAPGPTASPPGAGYGLIGMRQRAELYGGSFSAAQDADGYRVVARFSIGQPA